MERNVLSPRFTALFLGVSVRTLARWREELDDGPPFLRLGARRIGYLETDLKSWIETHRYKHRAQELAARPHHDGVNNGGRS